MLNRLMDFFSPPHFADDEDKNRTARYINALVLSNVPILLVFIIARVNTGADLFGAGNLILSLIIAVLVAVWFLNQAGNVTAAAYTHVTTIWVASTLIALTSTGAHGTTFTSYLVVALIAGLLLGWLPAIGYTALSILAGFGLAYAEDSGLITYVPASGLSSAIEGTVLLAFGAIFLYLIIRSFQNTASQERIASAELRRSNLDLSNLRDELEVRVQERTTQLESEVTNSAHRIEQLRAIAKISQEITVAQELSVVLPNIAQTISQQFGYYHVGIFLVDEAENAAVLTATNSEGGQKMLERGHLIPIGFSGPVGFAAQTGQPRLSTTVTKDRAFLENPELAETRSAFALPLVIANRVAGVLDLHSTEPDAFSSEDTNILSILANQVAAAIANARLFTQTRETLANSQRIYNKYIEQQWRQFAERNDIAGYRLNRKGIEIIRDGETNKQRNNTTSIPIMSGGQVIGSVDVRSNKINESERLLLEAAAQRVALALDNVRLLQEAQVRASKERTIGELGNKIGAALNIDGILGTAAQEINNLLPGSEVIIQITPADESANNRTE